MWDYDIIVFKTLILGCPHESVTEAFNDLLILECGFEKW